MRGFVGLAATAVALSVTLGVVGWVLVPAKWMSWLVIAGLPALMWAFLESANRDGSEAGEAIRRLHRVHVAFLVLLLILDVAPDLAMGMGMLGLETLDLVRRFRGALLGLFFMAWGNHLPKIMSPWPLEAEPFDWHRVHRFTGRVFILGGAGLIGAWIFLPAQKPNGIAVAIILGIMLLSVGRKMASALRYSTRGRPAAR